MNEAVVARTILEACEALAAPGSLAVAGGTAVGLLLRNRLIAPDSLVFVGRVEGLGRIAVDADGALRLGAMVTLAELAADPRVRAACPSLASAAAGAANPRVRAVATLGGHLAHADPRQDLPPVLLALGAVATVMRSSVQRDVPVRELLTGFMATTLEPDELIVEVTIPPRSGRRDRYVRFAPNSAIDFPTVGVAVDLDVDEAAVVRGARLALGGVAPTAVLVDRVEEVLVGRRPSSADLDVLADAARAATSPVDDQRGSAEYKAAMTGLWARRAVADLLSPGPAA